MTKNDDAFEARYMRDGTKVLHRDKRVSRKMAAILAVAGVIVLAQAISIPFVNEGSARPMPADLVPFWVVMMGLLGLSFFVMAVALGVLRFVVTENAVHVKYGLWGPTIPLESVVSCKVVDYDWLKYGGWGIRRGIDGSWAYVPGSGPVVEIVYRDGAKEKKVVLGANDPHALARSIVEATSGERVRVGASETSALERQAESEVETEALEDADDRARAPAAHARRID
mgnify:CR=1 FL=1